MLNATNTPRRLSHRLMAAAADLFSGAEVTLSGADLDALAEYYGAADGPAADRWFRDLTTTADPGRVGVIDVYICKLRDLDPRGILPG